MLADIRENRIDAVVAWDLDRLHRQPIELEEFIQLAEQKRLALATVGGEADLSTDGGRLFARIKGAVARSEIERKSARQRRQARQQAENGGGGVAVERSDTRSPTTQFDLMRQSSSARLTAQSLPVHPCIPLQHNGMKQGNDHSRQGMVRLHCWPTAEESRYKGRRAYKGEEIADAKWDAIVKPDVWQSVYGILTDPPGGAEAAHGADCSPAFLSAGNVVHPWVQVRRTPMVLPSTSARNATDCHAVWNPSTHS